MAPIKPQTLKKDVFQSTFTWNLENFCAMVDENLFSADLTTTEEIPIPGIPIKWQLGMTISEIMKDLTSYHPAVRFNLDFIKDRPLPEKYTKVLCDFKIGAYWSGKAVLFPTKVRQSDQVKQSTLKANVNHEGILLLSCRMNLTAFFCESKPSEHTIEDATNCVMKLTKDIGVLLEDEKHSDVTIVVKDQELKAHKFILAARSEVFSLMLEADMKEKLESRIEIPDVSVEAVKAFLKFLYTGEASPTQHSKDLLSLAALYQIGDLKEICGRMLISQLNKDNALENLFLANLHNCEELKQKAFEVITQQILREAIPDQLMNKPDAVEKLMNTKLKYDEVLQEARLKYHEVLQEAMEA